MRTWAIFIALAVPGCAIAQNVECKKRTDIVGECRIVHGEINNTADAGTILRIGNSRDRFSVLFANPSKLDDIFRQNFTALVYGEFKMCPLKGEGRFGAQNACIQSVAKIAVVPLDYIPTPSTIP